MRSSRSRRSPRQCHRQNLSGNSSLTDKDRLITDGDATYRKYPGVNNVAYVVKSHIFNEPSPFSFQDHLYHFMLPSLSRSSRMQIGSLMSVAPPRLMRYLLTRGLRLLALPLPRPLIFHLSQLLKRHVSKCTRF